MLEKSYEWLWQLGINENCRIISPAYYQDNVTKEQREIDVFIEILDDNSNVIQTIMVECRNREKIQDVRWVEEVVTKRNDMGIDRAIMVVTSSFTKPARIKAKYYGIEVERSSSLTSDFIEKQKLECKGTANFILMQCISLEAYTSNGIYNHIELNEYSNIKNYIKSQIMAFSYSDYFITELQKNTLSKETKTNFFDSSNNFLMINFSFIPTSSTSILHGNIFPLNIENGDFKEIGKIERINFQLKIIPKTIQFPLSRVITIFDDDVSIINSNKRHKSLYENDKIRIVFQLHGEKMYHQLTLKKINIYWRYIGLTIRLYALLENVNNHKSRFEITNRPEDILGQIYFGCIWN